MKNKRLAYLLNGYLSKTISGTEEKELFALLAEGENDEEVKLFMNDVWSKTNTGHQLSEAHSDKILSLLFEQETPAKGVPMRSSRRRIWWAAASIALLISISGIYYFASKKTASKNDIAKNIPSSKYKNDVAPGTTGAVLKLADGSYIVLDSASNGTLSMQGSMKVVKNGGVLNYVQDNDSKVSSGYNIIETPRGRQFELVLEDGTKVWLNAASSIRYPVVFDDKERKVEITGEAYFEVAKNKEKPFRVSVNGTTVEVLGTHFNINAYTDEASLNTTLLEGSVKVIKNENTMLLTPGQQAQVNETGAITKAPRVNTDEVMAWKNNNFSFNNTDLKKLMRQLSRWYDVEVEYKNNSEPIKFNGDISRGVTLSNVLKMLELTGEVSFAIDGKKIIVSTEN
ncbi:FecR family protein [Ferruginibacter sp.]